MTHYDTLGVDSDADASSIRDAYKRLALARHPDRARSGDARAFLELKRAYDCLVDATARKRYDAALASRRARPLAETIDAEEMDVVCVMMGREGERGASGGVDAYARACRCGDAYEIPVAELQRLRRELHDECVLECGGCSLRISVRLKPIGADEAHASARVARA
jgi:curved DNA-binding protein CbpA